MTFIIIGLSFPIGVAHKDNGLEDSSKLLLFKFVRLNCFVSVSVNN